MVQQAFAWIEATSLGVMVRESLWAFPILVGVHIMAIMLSVGLLVWFDLRLLGATMRTRPVAEGFRNLKGWMIAGFSLMFLSGALLFTAHAAKAYANNYFRAKIVLIVLAGINTAVYHVTIDRRREEWSDAAVPPLGARTAGLVSLVLWFSVIAAGRIFAYDL